MSYYLTTTNSAKRNHKWGQYSLFSKVAVIRGIGYRAYFITNDTVFINNGGFIYSRYLVIRAGHTADLYVGIPRGVYIKVIKKDRKLVISSYSKIIVGSIFEKITKYRNPSVYTGRGVRTKGAKTMRKAGKKDKQKGKSY